MRRNKMAPGQPDISPRNKLQQRPANRRVDGALNFDLGNPINPFLTRSGL